MKNIFLTILFAAALTGLFSCSEKSSNPVTATNSSSISDYFPSKEGSWWVYNSQDFDSTGAVSSEYKDSIYIAPSIVIGGKTAIVSIDVTLENGDVKYDTSYFYIDGSKLYTYEDFGVFSDNKTWQLLIDMDKTSYQIGHFEMHFDTTYYNPYIQDSVREKYDDTVNVSGQKNGTKNFTILNQTLQSLGFRLSINSKFHYSISNILSFEDSFVNDDIWLAKNIGVIVTEQKSSGTFMHDSKQELINYHIVK